jgi:hypothetical protein
LCEKQLLVDTRVVSVEEHIGTFLYALARNETLQDEFQHNGETNSLTLWSCA